MDKDSKAVVATTVQAPAPEKKQEKTKEEKKQPLMYVGPTMTNIGIQNRVYTEMPDAAVKEAEKTPEIKNLFISVEKYPQANKMLREKKGYIYEAYRKVIEKEENENE